MKKLSIEKMENLSGGSFGTCFDEAAAASTAWLRWTRDTTNAGNLVSFLAAEAALFACAMQ